MEMRANTYTPRNGNTIYGTCGTANGTRGFWNTDFQIPGPYTENEKNLVGAQCTTSNVATCGRLGADQTPVYKYPGISPGSNIKSPASFYHWFHNTVQNKVISNFSIPLTQQRSSNIYTYTNDSFFPIDNIGWADSGFDGNGVRHNYGFCLEAHTRFGYRGGEVFTFYGDDDVWVYINNYLVIDLGSLHQKEQLSVVLDDLPRDIIQVGNNYLLDFFYCERHTSESNLELTTSLEFYCAFTDWCGICEGNGLSCCSPQVINTTCNDHDDCTVDYCGPNGCLHSNLNCTAPDKCHEARCYTNGGCKITDLNCDDGDACTRHSCGVNGCRQENIVCNDNSECTIDTCDRVKGCVFTPRICNDNSECTIDTCNNSTLGGCVYTQRVCNDNSKCTRDVCDPNFAGGCRYTNLCDDSNLCTTDTCNPAVGCSNTPKTCGTGLKCVNDTCNPATGNCMETTITCPTLDACTTPTCSNSSGCSYPTIDCEDGDACTINTCNKTTGCRSTNVTCNDFNNCTIDSCSKASGCVFKAVDFNDKNACTFDYCDNVTGVHHTNVTCNDFNECTDDSCDTVTGCLFVPKNCEDGNPCTIDTCSNSTAGGCVRTPIPNCVGCSFLNGTATDCTTLDRCFPKSCDFTNGGCKNSTVNCDDNNLCTTDSCFDGRCSNIDKPCTPRNPCETATCDRSKGCQYAPITCDDSDPCTIDSCLTNGSCSNIRRATFCSSCGTTACAYEDPCKPSVCNRATSQCEVKPVSCDDSNACTNDTCVAVGGLAKCNYTSVVCKGSGDVCNPNLCDTSLGCRITPVVCADSDKCTFDKCDGSNGTAQCIFTENDCNVTDLCRPKYCNATTGACYDSPVVCNDGNACTRDFCEIYNGAARCAFEVIGCPSDDCGVQQCNTTTGICKRALEACSDGNPCTDDLSYCNGTASLCSFTENTKCDDNDACTNDVCDSSNSTLPCSHSNVTCTAPTLCHAVLGCDRVNGCLYGPLPCVGKDVCKIGKCDERAGCVIEDRVCTVKDPGCFRPVCDPSKSGKDDNPCTQEKLDDWAFRQSSGSTLTCAFRYDKTARNAAIGTGAAVGIAIGAAAAIGGLGYGGKKGYDMLKMMREQRFNGVQNNPLYESNNNGSDNPLYRYSTSVAS